MSPCSLLHSSFVSVLELESQLARSGQILSEQVPPRGPRCLCASCSEIPKRNLFSPPRAPCCCPPSLKRGLADHPSPQVSPCKSWLLAKCPVEDSGPVRPELALSGLPHLHTQAPVMEAAIPFAPTSPHSEKNPHRRRGCCRGTCPACAAHGQAVAFPSARRHNGGVEWAPACISGCP